MRLILRRALRRNWKNVFLGDTDTLITQQFPNVLSDRPPNLLAEPCLAIVLASGVCNVIPGL
jgi:hypothetical protein